MLQLERGGVGHSKLTFTSLHSPSHEPRSPAARPLLGERGVNRLCLLAPFSMLSLSFAKCELRYIGT